nr:polyphenol oxidase E, chloroplastic-like [Ipomoea batatas]
MTTSTLPIISCTNNVSFSTKSSPRNFSRPSQIFLNPSGAAARRGDVKIRCAASSEGRENPDSLSEAKLDRRNVLLGLGGLYGAYNLSGGDDLVPYSCCPPITDTTNVEYYKIPSFSKLNVRPAAHAVDDEYVEKFKTVIQKMKDLPDTDQRSFYNQAKGMVFPEIFEEQPLYDPLRNQDHRGGAVLDLAYAGDETSASDFQKVKNNLAVMYRQMVTNAPCPLLFFGNPIRGETGFTGSGMGTIENIPHNSVHRWVGDPRTPHNEDMGNFYSAARDPVFYCLHSNVDRMWGIWKTLGGKRKDITDPDWLQTEFLFYDETNTPVKVKVQDCLDNKKLGYTFQKMPTPWKNFKPTRKRRAKLRSPASVPASTDVLPTNLDKIITFNVARTATEKEEVLNLELAYDDTQFIRFDAFLNEDEDVNTVELDRIEYAGSFSNLPHVHEGGSSTEPKKTTFSVAISELLQDLGLEGEDKVLVTLVPKAGCNLVTVNSANITTVDC